MKLLHLSLHARFIVPLRMFYLIGIGAIVGASLRTQEVHEATPILDDAACTSQDSARLTEDRHNEVAPREHPYPRSPVRNALKTLGAS